MIPSCAITTKSTQQLYCTHTFIITLITVTQSLTRNQTQLTNYTCLFNHNVADTTIVLHKCANTHAHIHAQAPAALWLLPAAFYSVASNHSLVVCACDCWLCCDLCVVNTTIVSHAHKQHTTQKNITHSTHQCTSSLTQNKNIPACTTNTTQSTQQLYHMHIHKLSHKQHTTQKRHHSHSTNEWLCRSSSLTQTKTQLAISCLHNNHNAVNTTIVLHTQTHTNTHTHTS